MHATACRDRTYSPIEEASTADTDVDGRLMSMSLIAFEALAKSM
jgi:hypothetical protein